MFEFKKNCIEFYDRDVAYYIEMYSKDHKKYPSNQIRLEILLSIFRKYRPGRMLDIGCGPCVPIVHIIKELGCEVSGIDFSDKMIEAGRRYLEEHNVDPQRIKLGDVEKRETMPEGIYDAAYAVGVFPHLEDDSQALLNINRKLRMNGVKDCGPSLLITNPSSIRLDPAGWPKRLISEFTHIPARRG